MVRRDKLISLGGNKQSGDITSGMSHEDDKTFRMDYLSACSMGERRLMSKEADFKTEERIHLRNCRQ
jgi:hypothetical protein